MKGIKSMKKNVILILSIIMILFYISSISYAYNIEVINLREKFDDIFLKIMRTFLL